MTASKHHESYIFLSDIAQEFQPKIDALLDQRKQKKLDVDMCLTTPEDIVEYLVANAPLVVSKTKLG